MTLNKFVKKKSYLFWSTRNLEHLSREAIVEAVLNYGEFEDVKIIISILGMKEVAAIFKKQIRHTRVNYDPKIINYFKLYFKKYAQRDSYQGANRTFTTG